MPDGNGQAGVTRVQVAGSKPQDVGTGTARLGRRTMQELGLREGDVLEMSGKRASGAIVLAPYAEDEGLEVIRLDGLQRTNVGVSIGDHVEVRKGSPTPAKRVQLAPAQKNLRLAGSGEMLRRTLFHRPLTSGDIISTSIYQRQGQGPQGEQGNIPEDLFHMFFQQPAFGLQEIRLRVITAQPKGLVQIEEHTEIELLPEYVEMAESPQAGITYDDVGGLGTTIDEVRELIELPLKHPELFQRLGIDPPKGVLLHGPPGTGKTLLARAVADEADAHFFHIAGPEIMGRYYGESEQRLREVFEKAQEQSPSIIFIDEIDSIAPKREEVHGEVERRVVAQLLTLMDGMEPRQNVVVIGATNRVDALDEALRRPGRFDREIVVGVPDTAGRRQVIGIHTRGMPLERSVDLDELARVTYGFVGADLSALAREAAMETLRRVLPKIDMDGHIPEEVLAGLEVTGADFDNALRRVQPSALREIMIQAPTVSWDDVGGLERAKRALREGVELPLKHPEAFRRLGIRPAKGFLLFGPPGTGKTLLAKAVAREAEANFIAAKSSDLLSKWYGESEQQVSRLFTRARQVAPTVIFIDEIDSLAPERGGGLGEPAVTERVVNTLLAELDGLEELKGVVVIAASNRPALLDPALLRPGRFDELVYVPVPEAEGRRHILGIHTSGMPLADDVELDRFVERTDGYTGADLEDLVRRAGLHALRADLEVERVTMADFEAALRDTRASVTEEMEREYERLLETLKSENPRGRPRIGFAFGEGEGSTELRPAALGGEPPTHG